MRASRNGAFRYLGYIVAWIGMEPSLSNTGRGKTEVRGEKKKPVLVPLCPPQIPHVWLGSQPGSPRQASCN